MKNGLIFENDELIYYKNDRPYHAGVVEVDGDIYYIGSRGRAVTGEHIVHGEMTNDILERGTYTFGNDYKLIKGSFIPPKKIKQKKTHVKKDKPKKIPHKNAKKNIISLIVLAVILIAFLIIIGITEQRNANTENAVTSDISETPVELPVFDKEVSLCSEGAQKLYNGELTIAQAITTGVPYVPFVFEYDLYGKNGKLILSEHPDLMNPKEYILSSKAKSLTIDNLKTDTYYYYEVTVDEETYIGNFKTAAGTRYIHLPGVYNTRDIGGYTTLDGKKIKQGMIIRGTEIDGLVEPSYFLDSDYIEYAATEFGFVCDLDLREKTLFTGDYKSRLGENVSHQFYESPTYGTIFNVYYKQSLNDIFSALADPDNYPMYLHCTLGADRTGTIVFLLQGLLNVSEEDLISEYRLTSYFNPAYTNDERINQVTDGLYEYYEGDTLQEKIIDFLTNYVGITGEELQSIHTILLEE